MQLDYKLTIDQSWNHCVKTTIKGEKDPSVDHIDLLMPAWSPGSYFMREYARHVRRFLATTDNGEFIFFEKTEKGLWRLDWSKSDLKSKSEKFCISYEVYCNEVSVRTSHVDLEHAFIHGPSVFMAVVGLEKAVHQLEVEFPQSWTKLNTSLRDISQKRQHFIYEASSYDELVDCPIEIGTQATTGFMVNKVPHNIVNFREPEKFPVSFPDDCQKIVQSICDFWGEVPFDTYTFISHFLPATYGGLEHCNSTALQFDNFEVVTKKGYVDFLGLVSHEYFHSWNVKRIRPQELGPFDYKSENYTRMHWLTEGLTSFVDDLFVLKCGLLDQETYLNNLVKRINSYENTPGRYLDSLEDASFDAWIKLYRPHASSHNATVSYYLKGALAFFCLNSLLQIQGRTLQEFCLKLWQRYKSDSEVGVTKAEVLKILEDLAGEKVRDLT
jgi:predicted metalloprotease with PDZ domain